jgi:hypothetical protein
MTVQEVCKTQKDVKFGIDFYHNPKYDHRNFMRKKKDDDLRKILGNSKVQDKRIHFTDSHAELFKQNPGPAHKSYSLIPDWKESFPK